MPPDLVKILLPLISSLPHPPISLVSRHPALCDHPLPPSLLCSVPAILCLYLFSPPDDWTRLFWSSIVGAARATVTSILTGEPIDFAIISSTSSVPSSLARNNTVAGSGQIAARRLLSNQSGNRLNNQTDEDYAMEGRETPPPPFDGSQETMVAVTPTKILACIDCSRRSRRSRAIFTEHASYAAPSTSFVLPRHFPLGFLPSQQANGKADRAPLAGGNAPYDYKTLLGRCGAAIEDENDRPVRVPP